MSDSNKLHSDIVRMERELINSAGLFDITAELADLRRVMEASNLQHSSPAWEFLKRLEKGRLLLINDHEGDEGFMRSYVPESLYKRETKRLKDMYEKYEKLFIANQDLESRLALSEMAAKKHQQEVERLMVDIKAADEILISVKSHIGWLVERIDNSATRRNK